MPKTITVMEVFILTFLIMLLANRGKGSEQRLCWYTSQKVGPLVVQQIETPLDYVDDLDQDIGQIQGFNQTCPKRTNYCYALWKEDQHSQSMNRVIIIAQGCWETSGKQDCDKENCTASRKPPKALNDTNFCCCRGDFCNGNVTQMHSSEEVDSNLEILPTPAVKYAEKPYILVLIVLLVLFLFTSSCFPVLIILSRGLNKKKEENADLCQDSVHLMENGNLYSSSFSIENLRLEKIIGQGRYGIVWKGNIGSQEVAAKIFPSHYKNSFHNEVDIYSGHFMAHPNLLSYFGSDEHTNSDGNTEYFLFLSLAPNGPVQDYLQSNVLDWNTFCKMALSIAKGIAYLHSDIRKGEKSKPCICHRDLNTKNILVKEDLSCVICDFGFATKIRGSKYYYNGEEQHAEIKSINDVGTLRYMSPEVLEGAVNLRDCETSLKQIDVYALGLILWEVSTRCKDFYPPGMECAPYRLPFEAEIGHPTFEQMQILICKHKARPLFPDLWRDSLVVRSIKETIEDCWDQDAEARLTALCVEERLHELCGITERQKSVSLYSGGVSSTVRASLIQKDSQNVLIVSDNKEESCMSESTTDTTLAITPASIQTSSKNSNLFQGIYSSVQPYQGRNPCLERNLMVSHDMDSSAVELIDKSNKSITPNRVEPSSVVNDFLNIYPLNPTIQNFPNSVYNGHSNYSEPIIRSNAPIPFLQNMNSEYAEPKQSNLVKRDYQRKKISWKNFKAFFEKKQPVEDLITQIDCNIKSNLIVNENFLNLSTPTFAIEPRIDTQISLSNGKPETKIAAKDDSTFSKILKFSKPDTDSLESTTSFLRQINNKRPDTLPIVKNTEVSNAGMSTVQDFDKFLKNVQGFSVSKNDTKGRKNYQNLSQLELRDDYPDKAKYLVEIDKVDSMDSDEIASRGKIREFNSAKLNVINGFSPNKYKNTIKERSDKIFLTSKFYFNCNLSEKYLSRQRQNEVDVKNPYLRKKSFSLENLYKSVGQSESQENCTRLSLSDDRIISCYYDNEILLKNDNKGQDEKLSSRENIQFIQNV